MHEMYNETIKLQIDHNTGNAVTKGSKKIPYLRAENLKNHTLFRGTYLYSPYMGVPPQGKCTDLF